MSKVTELVANKTRRHTWFQFQGPHSLHLQQTAYLHGCRGLVTVFQFLPEYWKRNLTGSKKGKLD